MPEARCGDEILVHRDVVEVTEPILQLLERRYEFPPALRRPLTSKQITEEFRCVAELFNVNA